MEGGEGGALGRVSLAHDLQQLRSSVIVGQGGEPAAGLDARELAGVADGDDLRARLLSVLEQARCDPGRRHAGFVDHQHDATSEAAMPVGGAGHGVQRLGRDSRRVAQLASGPRRRRDAGHLVSRLPVGVGKGAQHRRLAGSGQRLHGVHAVPAGCERPNRGLLIPIQTGVTQGGVDAATLQHSYASVAATSGRLENPGLARQQANRRVPRLSLVVRGELLDARVGQVLVRNELEVTKADPVRELACQLRQRVAPRERVVVAC